MFVLFTDFGAASLYVGQLHMRLLAGAPGCPVVDLMHDAPPYDAHAGAILLGALLPWVPRRAIVLAVVDPGVGGERDVVAMRHRRGWLLAPDNGLAGWLADRLEEATVWRLDDTAFGTLSATFHGRDLFVPAALAIAVEGRVPGRPLSPDGLRRPFAAASLARIVHVDRYGNLFTGIARDSLPAGAVTIGGIRVPFARTFSDVAPGEPLLYVDSLGLVELAVNQGSAAERFGLGLGDPVEALSSLVE